tara:strand:+ start:2595 stop:2768 length:174 start_codon:yes stop_codon:yes gene_type:complete
MRDYGNEVDHFEREGYVIARGALSEHDLAPLVDRRAHVLHAKGKIEDPRLDHRVTVK